jgi:hypothetical protein
MKTEIAPKEKFEIRISPIGGEILNKFEIINLNNRSKQVKENF